MINKENIQCGDVVYYVKTPVWYGDNHIEFGLVEEIFSDGVYISNIEPCERRRVNGIPIDEFKSEEQYKKLPKGWTYNTPLFELTHDNELVDDIYIIDATNPEEIKEALNKGLLVPSSTIFQGEITADITKDGYRIIKRYPVWYMSSNHKPNYVMMSYDKVFKSYFDAKDWYQAELNEFYRQSELSDEEWSIEQINKTLGRYKNIYGKTDEEITMIREWLLAKDHIKDLVTRISEGEIQWKYDKYKKWYPVPE